MEERQDYSVIKGPEKHLGNAWLLYVEGGYIPLEDENYMNSRQLEYFRMKLLSWREKLVKDCGETLDELKKGDMKEVDLLDQGAFEANTANRLRIWDRNQELIREIDEALSRIDNGVYGYCEETGEEIGLKRLEACPTATLSFEAQEWRELRTR